MQKNKQTLYLKRSPEWPAGYSTWLPEQIAPVRSAGYTLNDLVKRGLLDVKAARAFQKETLLADFAWRVVWADTDNRPDAESIAEKLRSASGVVIFVHGWAGDGEIWEDLPALVVKENPDLIALVPDVNGFGGSPFSVNEPPLDKCNPPAIMKALESWIDIIGIRPEGKTATRPIIFVGHSMGGATLFFHDAAFWRKSEIGRIALAPALLLNDRQRQRFYKTLGTGIRFSGISGWLDVLVERYFAPLLIQIFAGPGSSMRVHLQHQRIFDVTPEGVIAQTFAAMGHLKAEFNTSEWPNFITILGKQDVLVGLNPTYELLRSINIKMEQIRQVEGGHYFFSVGEKDTHHKNRDLVMLETLAMHRAMSMKTNGRKK
jgi:pimeloyl-ACP methyl ester carboxylesterase